MKNQLDQILDFPDRAQAFYMLTDYYESVSDTERQRIRESWDFGKDWKYPKQGQLAQQIDGLPSCEQRIRASLIYDSIEDLKKDFRENLIGFCVIYHSAIEIGLNPNQLFDDVANLSSDTVASAMRAFIQRPPEDRSLKAFGWRKVVTQGNVAFVFS